MNQVYVTWLLDLNDKRELLAHHATIQSASRALLNRFIEWTEDPAACINRWETKKIGNNEWLIRVTIAGNRYEGYITLHSVD